MGIETDRLVASGICLGGDIVTVSVPVGGATRSTVCARLGGWRAVFARAVGGDVGLRLVSQGTDDPRTRPAASREGMRSSGASGAADGALRGEFEDFFTAHEGQVSSYLYRMTGDAHLASDLSQETFFRAWQHFSTLRTYEQPRAWLFRVATNLALQALRRRRAPVGAAVGLDALPWHDLPGSSDPARRFAEGDLVRETLLELPARSRAMLILREVYGLSGEEVAMTLKMKPNTVKVALFRARAQFRESYVRKGGRA